MLSDEGQHALNRLRVQMSRPRDAFERDVVDIAARHLGHELHACARAGGGQQKDQVHVLFTQAPGKFSAFLWRIIHHQYAVHTRLVGVIDKGPRAMVMVIALNRVGVPHQDHRGRGIRLPKGFDRGQDLHQVHAKTQCTLARFLDHRPVGHGVAKGDAKLNHVGTGRHQSVHQLHRDLGAWEAAHDVRDQGRLLMGLKGFEGGLYSVHGTMWMAWVVPPLTSWPRQLGRQ